MRQRRILMLGGIQEQIVAIQKARDMGLYVITCDNRPDNPGHALADEYYNISIADEEAVYELARKCEVDAVVCYALEAGMLAAAYAQERLGKPTSPYESVDILSNKILFRRFLQDNGFCCPKTYEEGDGDIGFPVVVKPADMWGSRGVRMVFSEEELAEAVSEARGASRSGEIIIEQAIIIDRPSIGGDAFSVDGVLTQCFMDDVYHDRDALNPLAPSCEIYPSSLGEATTAKVRRELQRLISLLHLGTTAYNIELRVDDEDNVYLMEVAPRNGGNYVSLIAEKATGVDMIGGCIRAALGDDCSDIIDCACKDYWVCDVLHTNTGGVFDGLWMDDDFRQDNYVETLGCHAPGTKVEVFRSTRDTIGFVLSRFQSREQQMDFFRDIDRYYHIRLR